MTRYELIQSQVSTDTVRPEPIDYVGKLRAMGNRLAPWLNRFCKAFHPSNSWEPVALYASGHLVASIVWDTARTTPFYTIPNAVEWFDEIPSDSLLVNAETLYNFIATDPKASRIR